MLPIPGKATMPLSLPDSQQQQQINVASANIPHVAHTDTAHHRPFTTFHQFSELPTELRSAIWKLTFEPRILALSIQEKNSPYHTIRFDPPWRQQDWEWEWDWAVSSSYTHPILLSVSHESRSVTLESYVALDMCRQGSPLLGHVYVDYSRDTFHFSTNYCDYMKQTLDEVPPLQKWEQPPIDPRLTKYIAIWVAMVPTFLMFGTGPRGDFTSLAVARYTSAAKAIGSICSHFTSLKAIWLAIDRRYEDVSEEALPPGVFLVEPIIENEDDEDFPWPDSYRPTYEEKISALVDAAKLEYPDLNIPTIGAKLHIDSSIPAWA